ncbi:hypothetical protein OH491_02175 [Termitidicoccus mucosus]
MHDTRQPHRNALRLLALAFALSAPGLQPAVFSAPPAASVIHRNGWSAERSDLGWADGVDAEAQRAAGTMTGIAGWLEYDFEIAAPGGWHELWLRGMPLEWTREFWLDGRPVRWLSNSVPADVEGGGKFDKRKSWFKETNLWLAPGKHTLRLRRTIWYHELPDAWELRPADPRSPAGNVRVVIPGTAAEASRPAAQNVVRAGEPIPLTLEGGSPAAPLAYELVALDETSPAAADASGVPAPAADAAPVPLASIQFPITKNPVVKTVSITFPRQGVFRVVARDPKTKKLLRPADMKAGLYVAIDTKNRPAYATGPSGDTSYRTVIDIDCAAEPPRGRYFEKYGPARVVDSPAGRYRESTGRGTVPGWGTDGFSYKFDLPEPGRLYRLRVDYPDNDRRTMGFWVTDNTMSAGNATGVINTGGIETGDRYPLTGAMLTHEAFFHPLRTKDLVVAVINLVPGLRAAAARIRIDIVDTPLPPAPAGPSRGREFGYWFEENGRWLRFFGGENTSPSEHLKTLEHYAQTLSHLGANLMFPTVNIYQGVHYPTRIMDGYGAVQLNETRLATLVAERHGCRIIPELYPTGQTWFDRRVMGLKLDKTAPDGVAFMTPEARDIVLRNRDGKLTCAWEAFVYNPLHPRVQQMYADIVGEVADMLGDSPAFAGISTRLMFTWQFQAWSALPGLDWGYDDWTIGQFVRDTGTAVPTAADTTSPDRFHQRYNHLVRGDDAVRERWLAWRCDRLFAFHQKLRDRIRQARADADLVIAYYRQDPGAVYSRDLIGQMREQGIDEPRYTAEPGIRFIASIPYGRRYSTPLADADASDPLWAADIKKINLDSRTAAFTGRYFEVNKNLGWENFGARTGVAAFDACLPTTANELELYSLMLADQDPSLIMTGGNGCMFGTPEIVRPFLREYLAIPDARFERLPGATDPVAVWRHRAADGTVWFYAVNRLPVPVTTTFSLDGASPEVRTAAGNTRIETPNASLRLVIEPYMLRSFRMTGGTLAHCRVETPPDYVEKLRPQIEGARRLRDDIASRRIVPEASGPDAREAIAQLDAAIAAFAAGHYWTARGQLTRLAATRFEYTSGRYIPGVLNRSVPPGVPDFTDAQPRPLQTLLDGHPAAVRDARDAALDEESNTLWVASADGLSAFDAVTGEWKRNLTVFVPHAFEAGTVQHPALPQPLSPPVEAVRIYKPDTSPPALLLVKQGKSLSLLDPATGRTRPTIYGEPVQLPPAKPLPPGVAALSKKITAPAASRSLGGFTQLKVRDGALHYIARGKLMRLENGGIAGLRGTGVPPVGSSGMGDSPMHPSRNAAPVVAYDPGPAFKTEGFESFAFAPGGDLYLASHWNGSARGVNLYRCAKNAAGPGWSAPEYLNNGKPLVAGPDYVAADLAFDAGGNLLVLGSRPSADPKKPATHALCSWNLDTNAAPRPLVDFGKIDTGSGELGLHVLPDGDILVAGGHARAIWRLAPDGKVRWETRRQRGAPPGYTDLRCPLGITADARGNLWVTDPTRHQLLRLDAATGELKQTFGSFADLPLAEGEARLLLNQPAGVAILTDTAGVEWLHIADTGTRRLLRFPLPPEK